MVIKEVKSNNSLKSYAIIAVGSGAITATKKIFENELINQNCAYFQCENEPLGCGGDVAIGKEKAEQCLADDKILCRLVCKKAIVISTLGGGTGTGGSPVVAKYLFDKGLDVSNIMTLPFGFEGPDKWEKCETAIKEMWKYAIKTIVINNDICKRHFHGRLGDDYFASTYGMIENEIINITGLGQQLAAVPIKKPWYKRIFGL